MTPVPHRSSARGPPPGWCRRRRSCPRPRATPRSIALARPGRRPAGRSTAGFRWRRWTPEVRPATATSVSVPPATAPGYRPRGPRHPDPAVGPAEQPRRFLEVARHVAWVTSRYPRRLASRAPARLGWRRLRRDRHDARLPVRPGCGDLGLRTHRYLLLFAQLIAAFCSSRKRLIAAPTTDQQRGPARARRFSTSSSPPRCATVRSPRR